MVVVGYPGAELLDIACVVSALQTANYLHGAALYSTTLASPGRSAVQTATGMTVAADASLERLTGPLDTLVVSGGIGYVAAIDDVRLVAHVRRLARETRRIASVCTGSGILAAAGLLDGRRVATHWKHAAFLAGRFPLVEFDKNPIFVTDGTVCTSAGVTAALDLTLAFIEEDVGAQLAREVARELVVYMQRPGNQAQMSLFTAAPPPRNSLVRDAVDFIESHLAEDLSTTVLAARLGVSERHLGRLFVRELDASPARFVRLSRAVAAAHLLTATDLTIAAITDRCGFGTMESMRQAFQQFYGVAPSHYRSTQSSAIAHDIDR